MLRVILVASVLLLFSALAGAAYVIPRQTMDSGGGQSNNGSFRLTGSVGQPEAHANLAANSSFRLRGGFWVGRPQTATSTEPEALIPSRFVLRPNVPNPFNPSTTIRFELPSSAKVRVAIYNLRGEQIRLLSDQELPAGLHATIWNGRDDQGAGVASGVYLVRVLSEDFAAKQKITLVK